MFKVGKDLREAGQSSHTGGIGGIIQIKIIDAGQSQETVVITDEVHLSRVVLDHRLPVLQVRAKVGNRFPSLKAAANS